MQEHPAQACDAGLPCHDGLHIGIFRKTFRRVLDAEPGLFRAAKGDIGRKAVDLVDPHRARFNPLVDRLDLRHISGPDRGGKAVFGIVLIGSAAHAGKAARAAAAASSSCVVVAPGAVAMSFSAAGLMTSIVAADVAGRPLLVNL